MERHSREDSIQHSQVVFFSNLPREEDKKKELLTIAGRFGVVEKHLFLTDQVSFFHTCVHASTLHTTPPPSTSGLQLNVLWSSSRQLSLMFLTRLFSSVSIPGVFVPH